MPFWSDGSKVENYKAKMEYKMCIAKETPESSFDLIDCNLSEVPSGVFTMCRVFLKESLLLDDNKLSTLHHGGPLKDLSHLKVLSLKNNRFTTLPEDIGNLTHLENLNLENNRLKKLPYSFGKLLNLERLNLKGNKFTGFPMQICDLLNLQVLNICDNPKIRSLPKELCSLVLLKCLYLDFDNFTYPSKEICAGGTESIMKFLCLESGKEYTAPDSAPVSSDTTVGPSGEDNNEAYPDLSAAYQQYQRSKEQKVKDLILMEKAMRQNYEIQSCTVADANLKRQKLLEDLAQEQERMENEILVLQSNKEKEKQSLLDMLLKVEDHSAQLVKHLVYLNNKNKNLDRMLAIMEKDRLESEEMFSIKQEELEQLRKKEILESMTETLQNEEQQKIYELQRNNVTAKLQNEENESNAKLLKLFQDRELDQQTLINELMEEELFQKQAFEALQLQKDLQHQEIARQIQLIEKELSSLTNAELKKRDLKITSEINALSENRTVLASLLSDLLAAKEQREKELRNRLNEMEKQRESEMEDFWLIQYQKLLDRKPKNIVIAELNVDPLLKQLLTDIGALDFLPFFAKKNITLEHLLGFTMDDLQKIGILDEDICQKILDNVWDYIGSSFKDAKYDQSGDSSSQPIPPASPIPTAPPEDEPEPEPSFELLSPSAPPLSPDGEIKLWCQAECVVCLESQSTSVFLPCGHVCCCQNCSSSLELCPMCRCMITSKFPITVS